MTRAAADRASVDGQVRLAAGRRVGYRIYGLSDGRPVYFFHGFPGSRLQAALLHRQALAAGVALVAFDRPGFGLSDPAPAPTVDSIAGDVFELADALGHRRLAVIGVSCGGPHALAAARLAPDRITAVGLLAGIGPMDRPELRKGQLPLLRAMFALAGWQPWLISPLLALDRLMFRRNPERAVRALASMMTPPDRRLVEASADLRTAFGASLAEAYRQGIGGALQEAGRIARFGDAGLDGIPVPVHVFQSGQDHNVPPPMGRFMAGRLAGGSYHDCPEEGHLSIVVNRFDECVRLLATGLLQVSPDGQHELPSQALARGPSPGD
ncbi:MAG: alpha/beta hydrolase [Burkholderiaceae bacterium]|nr:alpha/beta hydrolase [Burkholderiaceae bacterium]